MAVLLTLPVLGLLQHCGVVPVELPVWLNPLLAILVSAAVGYLTNYVAIKMLFEPYERTWKHWLPWVTLGWWQQGLVPRNKARIGREVGEQVESRLLNPQTIANELCVRAEALLSDESVLRRLRAESQEVLLAQVPNITGFLIPRIEESLVEKANEFLTPEAARQFWIDYIEPQLRSEDNRRIISQKVTQIARMYSPQLMDYLKREVRHTCERACDRLPFLVRDVAKAIVPDLVMQTISWDEVRERIFNGLNDPETLRYIQNELFTQAEKYARSPEAQAQIAKVIDKTKGKLTTALQAYLREELPKWLASALDSEKLWDWVENDLLKNHIRSRVVRFLQTEGRDRIAQELHIAEKVSAAIEKQDLAEFHEMVNKVAAEHLGAIQVLGFVLGAIIGGLHLLFV